VEVKGRRVIVKVVFFSSFKTTFSLYLKLYRWTHQNVSMEITLNDIFNSEENVKSKLTFIVYCVWKGIWKKRRNWGFIAHLISGSGYLYVSSPRCSYPQVSSLPMTTVEKLTEKLWGRHLKAGKTPFHPFSLSLSCAY